MPGTPAPAEVAHPTSAQIHQVQADLGALRAQLQGMKRDHSALRRTMERAPRLQAIAIALSVLVAAAAWSLGLSAWLPYGLAPLTVLMVLVFAVGSRCIQGWMQRKIHQLQQFADDASDQLATAQQPMHMQQAVEPLQPVASSNPTTSP